LTGYVRRYVTGMTGMMGKKRGNRIRKRQRDKNEKRDDNGADFDNLIVIRQP
jgi:hypothetical protein